jgi:hypothetical protein
MAPITIVAVLALFCGRVAAHPHMFKASGNGTNDVWLAPAVCSDHPSAALGTAHPVLVANRLAGCCGAQTAAGWVAGG